MSEQAKVAYLQEKIKQAKRNERFGIAFFIFGIILVIFSFIAPQIIAVMYPNSPALSPILVGIIGGILFAVLGVADWIYYGLQGGNLVEQLRIMAITIPSCPNCKKELPKGNFEFCPFCGKSLKS